LSETLRMGSTPLTFVADRIASNDSRGFATPTSTRLGKGATAPSEFQILNVSSLLLAAEKPIRPSHPTKLGTVATRFFRDNLPCHICQNYRPML
jgi:hypothetical protein